MTKKMTDSQNDGATPSNRPVPAPRSRHNIEKSLSIEDNALNYENIIIQSKPKKIVNQDGKMNNVIHEMSSRMHKVTTDETDSTSPVPAPRVPESPKNLVYPDLDAILKDNSDPKSTGAIRKAPPLPGKLNNNIKSSKTSNFFLQENASEDAVSLDRSIGAKSTDSTTSSSDNVSGKFKTSSPVDLLGQLGKSISERMVISKKQAAHKIDKNFKNTKKLLREKITDYTPHVHFSLGRRKEDKKLSAADLDDGRPKTVPANDEIFNNISFNSPLNVKLAKVNNRVDLDRESDSTYEIPRSTKKVTEILPTYDDVVSYSASSCSYSASQSSINSAPTSTSGELFERNGQLTQSMYTNVKVGGESQPRQLLLRNFNRSENDISKSGAKLEVRSPNIGFKQRRAVSLSSSTSEEGNLSDIEEGLPCPKFPAPVLEEKDKNTVYGKIKKSPIKPPRNSKPSTDVEYRHKPDYENTILKGSPIDRTSTQVNVDSTESRRIFSRMVTPAEDEYVTLVTKQPPKKRQPIEVAASASNSWAFYDSAPGTNAGNQSVPSISETGGSSLSSSPEPIYANEMDSTYGAMCDMPTSLLQPLPVAKSSSDTTLVPSTFDLLSEFDPLLNKRGLTLAMNMENLNLLFLEEFLGEDTYGRTSTDIQEVVDSDAESSDSDNTACGPALPNRLDSLPGTSSEPLKKKLDEHIPDSQTKSMIIHQNLRLPAGSMENILEESTVTGFEFPGTSKTTWFANNVDKLEKNNKIDPVNSSNASSVDKVVKSTPKLPVKVALPVDEDYLPSYDESMAEDSPKPVIEVPASPLTGLRNTAGGVKNIWNRIKRTPSLKTTRLDVKNLIEMVPKPPLTDRLVTHHGPLLKLPSGVMEDLLKELSPRTAVLREKIFYTFQDTARQVLKEQIHLCYVTSVQAVVHQKFNETDIHCFEISFALPKTTSSAVGTTAMSTNPNIVMSTTESGNVKTIRQSFIFAVYKVCERNLWMQKIFESMSAAFPPPQMAEFTRAGWCYMKKSITSEWSGAWILLSKRKLLLHSTGGTKLEVLDLRKMRCIGMSEADDSINNLHVERGSVIMIDCPPHTIYLIMSSPRNTKTWKSLIKEAAHANGATLKNQQLTKNNVPVLVDKCVNFVYTHGSMSEGIYRKSGSATQVQKLLTLFKQDAFSLQLVRTEYNEHDVSSALKKFMRELPEPLLGKFSDSFIVVSEMQLKTDKIQVYKELIARLPTVEYQTLRKIIGHLNFINSQKAHNKMGVENLAMIWGAALLRDNTSDPSKFSKKETTVVAELIMLYKNLYQPQAEEIQKEQIMLSVLQKYHAAAENLSDAVKMSGDLKVWIKLDSNPSDVEEEKEQSNVTLTPTKTVNDVCKEMATKMKLPAHQLTMEEVISNDELHRPMHYGERVLDSVLRWTYWPEADRKNNYLVIKPTKFLYQIERAIKTLPSLTPNMEVKYADQKTRPLKPYMVELVDGKITVFKREKHHAVKFKEIEIGKLRAYLGSEKKRDSQMRWGITLIEDDFKKRSRDAPFIGHLLAGANFNEQIVWYSSIMFSLHRNDVLAQPEIIIG